MGPGTAIVAPPAIPAQKRHPELTAAAVLAIAAAGIPLVVAAATGALGIPRNDDWAYARMALAWHDSGHLHLIGWNDETLVGQLLLAQPFLSLSRSLVTLQVLTAALGFVGAWSLYRLGRGVLGRRRALLVALAVVLSPIWPALVASFMSDVPAFALAMTALVMLAAARRRHPAGSVVLPIGATALALLAFSVRQTMAAVLLVCVVTLVTWGKDGALRPSVRHATSAVAVVASVSAAVFYIWRTNLAHAGMATSHISVSSIRGAADATLGLLLTMGALSLPVVVLLLKPVQLVRDTWAAGNGGRVRLECGLALAGLAVLVRVADHGTAGALLGDYLDPNGSYHRHLITGSPAVVVPRAVWIVVVGAAGVALWVLAVRFAEVLVRWRSLPAPLAPVLSFVLLFSTISIAAGFVGRPPWDRYLLPLLGPVWILVAFVAPEGWPRRARSMLPGLVLGGWLAVSMMWSVDSGLFDASRWQAAGRVVSQEGVAADQVDGGFEWVGWHADPIGRHAEAGGSFYSKLLSGRPMCAVVVANGPGRPIGGYSWLWIHNRFSVVSATCAAGG